MLQPNRGTHRVRRIKRSSGDPFEPFHIGEYLFLANALLPQTPGELIVPEPPATAPIDSYWFCRGMASRLAASGASEALVIGPPTLSAPQQHRPKEVGVVDIVLQQFPMVSDTASWEDIFAFRNTEESQRKMSRLRRWLLEISHSPKEPREIQEALLSAVAEYEETMRLSRLKYTYGPIRLFLSVVPECLEAILRLRPTQAAKSLLAIHERKIQLLEAERNAPGRALAYLPYLASSFAARAK